MGTCMSGGAEPPPLEGVNKLGSGALKNVDTNEDFGLSAEIFKKDLNLSYCCDLNLREITIAEILDAYEQNRITVLELTQCYLERIQALNPYLNAVIEVNPDAEDIARELDAEKKVSGPRRQLFGIPILLKANIGTSDKMETCAGSLALVGLKPLEDSEVVKRLRSAGAVILGKANLSEFANFRGCNIPSGWSGRGNQTKNPYVLSRDPSGSSSGSAVSVAANLCAASIGTETDGSIVSPSSANAVVGLKPTVGSVSGVGVIPLSVSQDSVGPITRNIQDAALIFDVISNAPLEHDYFALFNRPNQEILLQNLQVGVLRYPLWTYADENQLPELDMALFALRVAGVKVQDPIEVSEEILSSVSSDDEQATFYCEFKSGINEYLTSAVCPVENRDGECNRIQCLSDIIAFNNRNPCPEKYSQEELEAANATDGITDPNYVKRRDRNKSAAQKLIDDLLAKYGVDAISAPTDSKVSFFAAVSGYPIISVPAGIGRDGVPFGISFFGTKNSEEKLLLVGARLESIIRTRRAPFYLK